MTLHELDLQMRKLETEIASKERQIWRKQQSVDILKHDLQLLISRKREAK